MNLNDDYNLASRYRTIRKHLDSLGYRQALSLDALPLIEKLVADLIQTTDSLKHFKTVAQDNVEACSQLQLCIDPYKCDNARLVQECNQLHLDLIEAKEAHQRQAKDLKKKVYNLESECNNLQLASSKNLKRIKELETESSQKSKRIQELLGKCCKPLISNAGLATKKRPCYPLRRPSLEVDPLPRTKGNSSLPSLSKVEPKVVDLLAMADRKMNSLNYEVTSLKGELSMQVDNVYTMKAQLAIKEKEILRLQKMLEGGRPLSAVSKDCSCKKTDQCNEHNGYEKVSDLHTVCHKGSETSDLRILQQVKSDLEQQLREALDKQHDAMSQAMKLAERNEELEKELRDIDHIALAVEADCNSAVKENNKRVSHLQEKLENVMTQVHVLEGELMVERRSGQELRADLEAGRLENRNLQRKLDSTLNEKKQMTDRMNQLTVIEENLNDEIQRLSRDNGNLKQEVARLDCANSLLKKKMHSNEISQSDKEETKKCKEKGEKNDRNKGKMLKKKTPASRAQRRSLSPPVHEKQTETTRHHVDSKDDEVTRDSNIAATRSNSEQLHSDKDSKISQLQSAIDQVQTDRDYYKNEYNRLREQCMKNSEVDNAELWGQVCELRRQLIDKEHAVLDLQREKKELCREKFELELRLQSSRSDRRSTCHPCGQCRPIDTCACPTSLPSASGDSKVSTVMLERLERERDSARADVDRLVEERDVLRERLKLAVEAHKFEQRGLRQNLCDVETRLKQLERERQDIFLAQGTQRATIGGFEDQLKDLKEELRRTKQDLTTQRTQYFQLRTLQDQADQALGDVQSQLSQTEGELYKAMERNRLLEQQRLQLDNEVKGLKQQISTIRANVSRGDEEKDQILTQLDERNERIGLLEREIKIKEQEAASMEQQHQELQQKNQLCVDQSAEQERRLRNMQMEMEIHQRQLAAASSDRDNAAQENRRLQDDLAAVTCEIRTLQRELEVSRGESYDLKRQLQTYVSEVRRAEDLINRKENERTEMLNHFRSLSLEATMLENNNHSLESEAAEARGALQSARDRSLDLERQLTDRDCMIRGYETQITELTQTVAGLETQIRQQMEQRQRAEADLNAVRDLCVKLDQQKETLVKELGDKDATKAQYEAQLARLKAEQNMVQDQINRDHVTVERLETLLDQARQESMDSQTSNQELQCEMSRLKHRMCELQAKLSTESAELRRYQNQAAEYSKQISELRRQVTNERFDRARKDEEHRRNCHCRESGKSTSRGENFTVDSSHVNAQPRRLDCSSANVQSGSSPRYSQSGKSVEYRSRDDPRIEAQRTNRFDTSNVSKGSPITTCKCTESNSKMYNDTNHRSGVYDTHRTHLPLNADISTREKEVEVGRGRSTRSGDKTRHEHVNEGASSNYGGLCVRARLEEDTVHKDIRVRISDCSACAHFDADKNKTTVVKFCTPLVCKETIGRRDLSANQVSSIEVQNQPNATASEIRRPMEANEAHRGNMSSEINEQSQSVHRDNMSSEQLELSMLLKRICCDDDNISSYDKPELPKFLSQNVKATVNNEDPKTNETLQRLKRLLEDGARTDPIRERSRSLPRGGNCQTEFHSARSNLSFPVRVDYSEASITAADLTRPEFVQMLTEIKEQTRNVEKELSAMNNAMKSTGFNETLGISNELSLDIPRVEKGKNKARMSYEKTDKQQVASRDVLTEEDTNILASSTPAAVNSEKEKKTSRKKKKNSNASSQIDYLPEDEISALKANKSKKFGLKSRDEIRNEEQPGIEGENLEGKNSSSHREKLTDDTPVTVDESVMVKPSKIHKLKKLSTSSGQSTTNEGNPCIANSRNLACVDERTLCSGLLRSPSRMGSSPPGSPARSMIPKRRGNHERPKSASIQSSDTRATVATSVADLHLIAPPTTPTNSEHNSGVKRGRQQSRYSLTRLTCRSPSNSRKNTELRSHSIDSNRTLSIDRSIVARALNDTVDTNGKSKNSKMEISTKPRSVPRKLELSCPNNICNTTQIASESTRLYNQINENSRVRTNSSQFTKMNNPTGRPVERHKPCVEYLRDGSSFDNTQQISTGSSRPTTRKPDFKDKLLLTNYPSNSKRLECVGTVKTTNNVNGRVAMTNNNDKKFQQRSRSDPRETRNYAGRSSR